jgi:hypothetical protein
MEDVIRVLVALGITTIIVMAIVLKVRKNKSDKDAIQH